MDYQEIIDWLLEGDVSLQYQVHKDLLGQERPALQARIATEGWGSQFLARRRPDGHWGLRFYQPKWISTHYTLLDLRYLCMAPATPSVQETVAIILDTEKAPDGGIKPVGANQASDVCVNGMFLNYSSYFGADPQKLRSVVDMLLSQHMADGGFNCRSNGSGARHSSLHTTLSVLEGFAGYRQNGYLYRLDEINQAVKAATEFILMHQLYLSDRTGEIINPRVLKLVYPGRWYYDILKALDYFATSGAEWDSRMEPAWQILLKKRNQDGTWNVQSKHPGQVHFEMEKAGRPSRWNTLRALRVLKHYGSGFLKSCPSRP